MGFNHWLTSFGTNNNKDLHQMYVPWFEPVEEDSITLVRYHLERLHEHLPFRMEFNNEYEKLKKYLHKNQHAILKIDNQKLEKIIEIGEKNLDLASDQKDRNADDFPRLSWYEFKKVALETAPTEDTPNLDQFFKDLKMFIESKDTDLENGSQRIKDYLEKLEYTSVSAKTNILKENIQYNLQIGGGVNILIFIILIKRRIDKSDKTDTDSKETDEEAKDSKKSTKEEANTKKAKKGKKEKKGKEGKEEKPDKSKSNSSHTGKNKAAKNRSSKK